MIVNIAGWLYLIYGVLGLGSLSLGPFSFAMSKANLMTLAGSVLYGLIGYGLLKRDSRARWWALGSSLISWVVGGLIIVIGFLGLVFLAVEGKTGPATMLGILFSGGAAILGVFLIAVFVAIFVAVTIVHYKLFWYLCSHEGCAEFGAPHGSAVTVLASAGAWIAVALAQVWVASSGMTSLLLQQALSRDERQQEDGAREYARQQTRAALEREAERKHAAVLEEARLAQEQAQSDEQQRAVTPETYENPPEAHENTSASAQESAETAPADSEAPAPVFGEAAEAREDSGPKPNKILKCRDKSGAVSYTQGYCPPGTTLVDTPRYE